MCGGLANTFPTMQNSEQGSVLYNSWYIIAGAWRGWSKLEQASHNYIPAFSSVSQETPVQKLM